VSGLLEVDPKVDGDAALVVGEQDVHRSFETLPLRPPGRKTAAF
jgi:hypothetical protein